MEKQILADGNQIIASAALDAGIDFFTHYPGSPVNRVANALERHKPNDLVINNALNEHVSTLSAMGASLCGARSLVVMKHVGLNIAADPLNYSAVCKIRGGMVVVVGTDPGARSSTGEEDVHWYAPQFNLPLLEPATPQGLYDSIKEGFEISERHRLPVLVFVPGRLAYQSGLVQRSATSRQQRSFSFEKDQSTLINVGQRAVVNHRDHIQRMAACASEAYPVKTLFNQHSKTGLITRSATFSVVAETVEMLGLQEQVYLLNIERSYPLHVDSLLNFAKDKHEIIIIEDQDGFLETMIKRDLFGKLSCQVDGKNHFPAWGEISIEQVTDFLAHKFGLELQDQTLIENGLAPERPGTFCEGCPHRASFFAIDQALKKDDGIIGGDIGCSSLPPHRTDWLLCMNAGIGISQGIASVLPHQSMVSTGGEGSFFHGGINSLQSAIENNINLTHILFDNRSIAMTGHQDSPTSHSKTDMKALLKAIGVDHVFEVNAFSPRAMADTLLKANGKDGVKVLWVRGNCALQADEEMQRRREERFLKIDNSRCGECTLCYEALQCPAIERTAQHALEINMSRCRRCAACLDVCPNKAIIVTDPALETVDA